MHSQNKSVFIAGIFLGVGLGGFFDGILFHQLLQVHGMLSAKVPKTSIANMQINMFWDGIFHAFTWAMTVAGVILLWRAGRNRNVNWSTKLFVGSICLGWGLFNCVEGVINHHILNLHHVVESYGQSLFDYAFLALGLVLIIVGLIATRSANNTELSGVSFSN